MLGQDDRATLLRLLEPPAGYRMDAAVGTTYSLDLNALLTLPTAFALASGISAEDVREGNLTPLELLDALRSYSDRITTFCQAGQIYLPSAGQATLHTFLERSVVPVMARRGGVFHPKLWAIRYLAEGGAVHHRLLIASRNLTFDRSWDTVVCLEEASQGAAS